MWNSTFGPRLRWLPLAVLGFGGVALGSSTALVPSSALAFVAVVAGVGTLLLVLRRPRAWLGAAPFLVLIASTKFRARDPFAALAGSIDVQIGLELGIYGLVGVIIVSAFAQTPEWRRLAPGEFLILSYAGLACLSTLWSPTPSITAVRSGQLVLLVLLGLGAARLLGPERAVRELCFSLVLYVLLFAALGSVVGPSVPTGLFETEGGIRRFTWFAVHPGVAAFGAAAAIVGVFAHLLAEEPASLPGIRRFLPWLLLPPLFVVLVTTRARTEVFALLGAMATLTTLRYVRPHVALPLAAAAASLGSLLALAASDPMLWVQSAIADGAPVTEFLTRGQTLEELGTLSGRTELWAEILPLVGERWGFGHGYLGSRQVLLERIPWASYAHNALAQSLLDLGIVGAALLWSLFLATLIKAGAAFVRAGRGDHRRSGVVLGLLLLLLLGAVTGDSIAAAPGLQLLVLCYAVGSMWAPEHDV